MHVLDWGDEAERQTVMSRQCLVFGRRSRHLMELLDWSVRFGERTALTCGGRRVSFVEQRRRVDAAAGLLHRSGVAPGDRVLLLGSNQPEWVLGFWAAVAMGALPVLGNGWWSEDEAGTAVDLVRPAVVVADERARGLVGDGVPVVGYGQIAAAEGSGPPTPAADEDDPALLLFTSGTTGLPKAAVLSHRAVIANQHNLLHRTRRLPHQLDPTARPTVAMLSVPLFHLGGLQSVASAVMLGSTLAFLSGRFDPAGALDLIEAEGVTTWAAVPTMVQRVLDEPTLATRDLTGVRTIMVGGAPVHPTLLARIGAAFPNARRGAGSSYGLTEAGGVVATGVGDELARRPGSVGRPLATVEVRIAGDGEILVRSPTLMQGYWGTPGAASGINDDGWLATGDIGHLDGDGYLFITDRAKDLVIRGGENIASANVERALASHPAVAEVAVIGLAHADLGEEVGAVVVARSGHRVRPGELGQHATRLLARFEVPSRWWLHDGPLPTTPVGKVDKRTLRDTWPCEDLLRG